MAESKVAPGHRLLQMWRRFASFPGGGWLFSRLLGLWVPYTSTIGAQVELVRPGQARVALRDRRRVRNHLNSIHAVALVNLGEVVSGLALLTGLSPDVRGIITGLSAQYFKKARGRVVAECVCAQPEITEDFDYTVTTDIRDGENEVVARIDVYWRLGKIKQ